MGRSFLSKKKHSSGGGGWRVFFCFISPLLHLFISFSPQGRPGKSETYLEAIRKNIEWLKKHSKEDGKDGEKELRGGASAA